MKKCMIGERYGSLVVIEKVKIQGKPKTYWKCQCDCGNTCVVEDSHLKNGHTKSCGCRRRIRLREKRLDLTGQRYGRLVVLGPATGNTENLVAAGWKNDRSKELTASRAGCSGKVAGETAVSQSIRPDRMSDYWLCQCDCGKQCVCRKENLRSGVTRSCGCLQEEQRKVNMKKAIHFTEGTCVERIACRRTFSNNTSGHRGVYRRENNRWRASIGFQGKSYNLGSFATYEEAVQARLDAEKRFYDPFLEKYREENS